MIENQKINPMNEHFPTNRYIFYIIVKYVVMLVITEPFDAFFFT